MCIRDRYVCRHGGGVTTWVTLCGWWCHGHDVWITLRGKHCVADAVEMTLRGWWCVSIPTGVKTQFRISKWIAHMSVLYNIDVTCRHGNDTTSCIILHSYCVTFHIQWSNFIAYFDSCTYNCYWYQSILLVCHLVCELAYIRNVYVCLCQ